MIKYSLLFLFFPCIIYIFIIINQNMEKLTQIYFYRIKYHFFFIFFFYKTSIQILTNPFLCLNSHTRGREKQKPHMLFSVYLCFMLIHFLLFWDNQTWLMKYNVLYVGFRTSYIHMYILFLQNRIFIW